MHTPPRNILLIVVESARADAASKTIGHKLVMPKLNALSASGMSSSQYYSHSGFTSSSLSTMFNGSYSGVKATDSIFVAARRSGWRSAVISGQDETWGDIDRTSRHRELADYFYDPQVDPEKRVFSSKLPSSIKLSGQTLVDAFKQFARSADWDKRHLIYMNFQAAHFPYYHAAMPLNFIDRAIPRSKIKHNQSDWVQNTYWNALSYADSQIANVVAYLDSNELLEQTLVLIVGDHGEELFEDQYLGHGHAINRRQLNSLFASSRPDLFDERPFGHIDLHAFLHEQITGSVPKNYRPFPCVFHYVGSLRSPASIGETCKDQRRYINDFMNNRYYAEGPDGLAFEPDQNNSVAPRARLLNRFEHHLFEEFGPIPQ
jgi:membrane-anchored protein YejM (alkaline phosphatase superfamily)